MSTENFPGRFSSLTKIRDFVRKAARRAGLDESQVYAVQLAVDEACSNIIEHAYGGEGVGEIQCTCKVNGKGLTVVLRDRGQPFDPGSIPEPLTGNRLEDLAPGGAGLYLMRKMMDEVTFEFSPETGNVLTMTKRKGSQGR